MCGLRIYDCQNRSSVSCSRREEEESEESSTEEVLTRDYSELSFEDQAQTEQRIREFSSFSTTDGMPQEGSPPLILKGGASMIGKGGRKGDDAFFFHERGVGVSDGVSGWSHYGIDPSLFSNELMENCRNTLTRILHPSKKNSMDFMLDNQFKKELDSIDLEKLKISKPKSPKQLNSKLDPVTILSKSYKTVKSVGSGTATLCVLNGNVLTGSNIGDSGFLIMRDIDSQPEIIAHSQEQQHQFNIPFQLSHLPNQTDLELMQANGQVHKASLLRQAVATGNLCHDAPADSSVITIDLKEGDFLILGTDGNILILKFYLGLFDNLFRENIIRITQTEYMRLKSASVQEEDLAKVEQKMIILQKVAEKLMEEAYETSRKWSVDTPFNRRMEKALSCSIQVRRRELKRREEKRMTSQWSVLL